ARHAEECEGSRRRHHAEVDAVATVDQAALEPVDADAAVALIGTDVEALAEHAGAIEDAAVGAVREPLVEALRSACGAPRRAVAVDAPSVVANRGGVRIDAERRPGVGLRAGAEPAERIDEAVVSEDETIECDRARGRVGIHVPAEVAGKAAVQASDARARSVVAHARLAEIGARSIHHHDADRLAA
ncbi:MAG: hypothetical protein ACK55I_07965, partial [bacterium]